MDTQGIEWLEWLGHGADLVGVAGAALSIFLFFRTRNIRRELWRRFEGPGARAKLQKLEETFRQARADGDSVQVKKQAAGAATLLLRLKKAELATIARADLALIQRVAKGTSDEHARVEVLLYECREHVAYALEDDRWNR